MQEQRQVRGEHTLVRYRELEDHGFSIQKIKEWRDTEHKAGRPGGLEDFYAAYGICFDCEAHGAQMIGWSAPSVAETKTSNALGVNELPLYGICPTCCGSGKADRSKWKRRAHVPG